MSQDKDHLWLAWGLWCHFWLVIITVILGGGAALSTFIDTNGNLAQRFGRWWGRTILWICGIPIQVEGLEHLRPDEAYVFAANHRSNFDIFVLITVLPGKILWVAKKSLFRIPILGQALSRMGSVPIDRGNFTAAFRSLRQAGALVRGGASMIIFPEGTRSTTRELLPFKKGGFLMAFKAGQPVVPVSISGTLFIQPRGSFRVRPGPIKVVISPPINPKDFHRKEELMAVVRQAIEAHYDPDFPYGSGGGHG